MVPVIKSTNIVTLNYAQAVLKDFEIPSFLADTNASILDGSVGVLPQRLMVLEEDEKDARKALSDADLGKELCDPSWA